MSEQNIIRSCGVSLFLLVHWPSDYEGKGSKGSMLGCAWHVSITGITFWDSVSVIEVTFILEQREQKDGDSSWGIT